MPDSPEPKSSQALDLSRAPAVLLFYGLTGAGKSFAGNVVKNNSGWHLYEADEDLTPEMKQSIAEKKPFTPEMRDRYFGIVAQRITELRLSHDHIVVTQATYKRQHRQFLTASVPGLETILIEAEDTQILERLKQRGNDVGPDYANIIKTAFERPAAGAKVIINNGDEATIISQLNRLYGKNSDAGIQLGS
jgi:gluconate kinase